MEAEAEAEAEAEVEVVGAVEDTTTAELDDWTEEKVLAVTRTLDD